MAALLAVLTAAAALGLAVAGESLPGRAVPAGDLLVSDLSGRLLVLDRHGELVRRSEALVSPRSAQGIALAPDRNRAFVSVLTRDRSAHLYVVDLATGAKQKLADAISPALSPGGTRLAYVSTEVRTDIVYRVALVVRDLRTSRSRSIRLGPRVPLGTPPELVIDWAPDGRRIAVFDGSRIRLVDVATAVDVESQPGVPGDSPRHSISPRTIATPTSTTPNVITTAPPPAPREASSPAPVFLDARTLVVDYDCCIGAQHLVAFDLRTGRRTAFATLSSPVESVSRLEAGLLLAVTALYGLVLVSRGHTTVIATQIAAATH